MKKNSVAKNYIYNLTYQILTILLPLITTPYLSRVLGAEKIGIYGYTTSIVTYFILFGSLGIAMYGQREIAYNQDNREKRSKVFWELFLIRFISLFIFIMIFVFIFCINGKYTIYYQILLIQIIANMFDISWFFQGIEEFDKTVVRNIIVKILSLILIFLLVKNESDLWKYFLIFVSAELIGNISIWLYITKYINKLQIKKLNFKKHIKPTLLLFLPQIAIQIYTVLDKTMLGIMTNMSEVGFYEQAQKIVRVGTIITGALQIVMNSRIANAFAKKDDNEIKKCLEQSFKFTWLISTPIMFEMIGISKMFVPWFFGKDFDKIIDLMMVSSPIIIAIGLSGIIGIEYLVQTKQQKVFTKTVIYGSIINVTINAILIPFIGGIGAAISSVIAETGILLLQLKYFKHIFLFIEIISFGIKNLIAGTAMLIILVLLSNNLEPTIINTFIVAISGLLVYSLMLFIFKDKFFKEILAYCKSLAYNFKRKKCDS